MFSKWFKSSSGNEKKEEKEPVNQVPDLTKYVRYEEKSLVINDYKKELTSLPDNFFESYTDAVSLEIFAVALTSIPASVTKLIHLKKLDLSDGKFRTLPDLSGFLELERFAVNRNNLLDMNKELPGLQELSKLRILSIGGYRGNSFPEILVTLKQIKHLSLGYGLEKKIDFPRVFNVIARMPWLESLKLDFRVNPEDLTEDFRKLDFLHEIVFRAYFQENKIPSVFGLMDHANFEENTPLNEVSLAFREKYGDRQLPDQTRQLLFCFYVKNYEELKKFLPDKLREAFLDKSERGIVLLTKVKGLTQKKWKDLLAPTSFHPAEPGDKGELIYIVGTDTGYETFAELVLQGKTIAFQDQLQDLIISLEDPWLLQKDNSGLNDQLLQLLASNQPDNYKVAFEIIENGGANKTVQSLLAAIMLSHPDKTVFKGAERLYDKYGSTLFKQHCKQHSSYSLRKSGNTLKKLHWLLQHPDVDEFVFRLMHHVIAASNPNIKDVVPHVFEIKDNPVETIPEVIKLFGNIETLNFNGCTNLNLDTAIPLFKQMKGLKQLVLNGCHRTIPACIEELMQLEIFEAEYNEFRDASALKYLTNLKQLNVEGCKLDSFGWLPALKKLTHLNLNNNKLTTLPTGIFELPLLTELMVKQNKLTEMDPAILKMRSLNHLDYSNNLITRIDYRYFGMLLNSLLLRSNKIETFEWKKIRDAGITSLTLEKLNLAANALSEFSLGDLRCPNLKYLDISNNKIKVLHPSVFLNTDLRELYAGKNQIEDVPDSITTRSYYERVWLQDNKIKELKESFAKVQISNCDLSNNQIEKLHPSFQVAKEKDYSRLFWKMKNNPVVKELTGISGLWGR